MSTVDATVGGPASNSFITIAEADTYFSNRLPLTPPWDDADDPGAAVITATKAIVMIVSGMKTYYPGPPPYYVTRMGWTGAPASTTQRLPWPRIGMYDRNGNPIPSNVIPQDLKEATAEFAGQLLAGDRTLDNSVIVQGLTSVRAGSVALSFKDNITAQVIPDAVLNLLVPSWLTDDIYTPAMPAEFDVIQGAP